MCRLRGRVLTDTGSPAARPGPGIEHHRSKSGIADSAIHAADVLNEPRLLQAIPKLVLFMIAIKCYTLQFLHTLQPCSTCTPEERCLRNLRVSFSVDLQLLLNPASTHLDIFLHACMHAVLRSMEFPRAFPWHLQMGWRGRRGGLFGHNPGAGT